MREDMFKVIVERPRSGRSWASKSKLRYVKGEGPSRMTGKRIVTLNDCRTKNLNENLAPLKRYLHKQCGRKWDDVFSDICQHLDTGSTVKMHVREHIDDFVERNVWVDAKGTYWAAGRWGDPQPPRHWSELYVDPQDGLVKETASLCRKLGQPTRREYWRQRRLGYGISECGNLYVRKIDDGVYLVQKLGIWYQFELTILPLNAYGYAVSSDDLYAYLCGTSWHEEQPRRVISKRQLSSKMLSRHGLHNDGAHYG